jgi:glycosyltransferase involved in cell wall biosynthesis
LLVPRKLRALVNEGNYDLLLEDINKIPFYTPLYVKIKTLVIIPHLFATTVFHETNPILGTYVYLAEKPLVSIYKGKPFNVISESTAEDMVARGVPKEDVSVIHCGIDRTTYAYDSTVTKYNQPTVLYLGRIKKYKSVQHLISAFARVVKQLPNAKLMVVGAGDYLPELEKQARELQLGESIEFPGFVSVANKVERMRKAHVAVLPSLKEGWGLTNIEANSVGTTVIAANVPGLKDSVRHNQTGLLYEYGNIDQLTESVLSILTNNELRERLEQGALEWAESFNWDSAARKFNDLIHEVVKRS